MAGPVRDTNVISARVMNQPGGELFGPVSIGGTVISSGDLLFGDAKPGPPFLDS